MTTVITITPTSLYATTTGRDDRPIRLHMGCIMETPDAVVIAEISECFEYISVVYPGMQFRQSIQGTTFIFVEDAGAPRYQVDPECGLFFIEI